MWTSTVGTFMLAGMVGRASIGSAMPTCQRVASQWTVVFKASCTDWYNNGGAERGEPAPGVCSQEFSGDVKVNDFPWNDDVVVVDSQNPNGDFTTKQPEQEVAQYGAGIVLVQRSWDVGSEGLWSARQASNAESVNASVVYVTTEEEKQKFVSFHSMVAYSPPPTSNSRNRRLGENTFKGAYDFNDDIDGSESSPPPLWMGDGAPSMDEDMGNEGVYYPEYIYSYEHISYDLSYNMDFSYLHSYKFDIAEDEAVHDDSVRSITAVDIYVCVDEENSLAEMRFYCNPDNMGTAACYEQAAGANVRALGIHGFEMYCAKECLTSELGGLWCDIFGLDGCRMCSMDCSAMCDGAGSCPSCVSCPPDHYRPELGTTPGPTPTNGGRFNPAPSVLEPNTPAPVAETPSPTPGSTGFDPVLTPPPVPDFGGMDYTHAPTSAAEFTPSPISGVREGLETAAPTWFDGPFVNTASPTYAPDENDFSTAAPTSTGVDGFGFVCTPGDADTCYNKLPAFERDFLEDSGRGLTCEESCLVNGGPWCKAYGLDGCRFCHVSCAEFCMDEGLPEGCLCFEC